MCTVSKEQTTHGILSYISEHPGAQDTLEGIVEWWLLEQRVEHQITVVKEALAELVARRLVIERRGADARTHYRVNRRKSKEISALLKQQPERIEER
jgi:hypothetical protein